MKFNDEKFRTSFTCFTLLVYLKGKFEHILICIIYYLQCTVCITVATIYNILIKHQYIYDWIMPASCPSYTHVSWSVCYKVHHCINIRCSCPSLVTSFYVCIGTTKRGLFYSIYNAKVNDALYMKCCTLP